MKVGVDAVSREEEVMDDEGKPGESLEDEVEGGLLLLTSEERRVIESRFGLRDGRPQTLQAVADELRLSPVAVRALEEAAMKKLQGARDGR